VLTPFFELIYLRRYSFSKSAGKLQQPVPGLFVLLPGNPFRIVTLKEYRFMMRHPEKTEH
jgi:hypothetical protein